MKLPEKDLMHSIIERNKAWKRNWLPFNPNRAAIYKLKNAKYHDQLLKDIGEDHLRSMNPFKIVFAPLLAPSYTALF